MTVKKSLALALIGLFGCLLACKNTYIDPSVSSINRADSTIQAYLLANGINATQSSTGVYYAITTKNPAGKTPAVGEEMAYTYIVHTLQGKLLDSSQNNRLNYIPLGAPAINAGLQEIFSLMHVGETASAFLYSSSPVVDSSRAVVLAAYTPYRDDIKLVASRTEDEQIDQYVADNKLTVTEKTASGLRLIKTVSNPTATTLSAGQTVTVKYSGITIHATQPFDPGTTPLVVTLGKNQVRPGFEEGISKLRLGEKATIIFPSAQGYGAAGVSQNNQYIILPYAPLIFTLEILAVQ